MAPQPVQGAPHIQPHTGHPNTRLPSLTPQHVDYRVYSQSKTLLSFRAPTQNGLLYVSFRGCDVTNYGRDGGEDRP